VRLQGEKPKRRSVMNKGGKLRVSSVLGFSFMRVFLCEVSKKESEKRGERVRVCACESE